MASRYWVGGTASWDGTAGTKWALTSGGAGGQPIPTTSDDVFFDANSGASTVTITSGNAGAKSITCTGFTGTLTGTATISIGGSITLVSGMTYTYAGAITMINPGNRTLTTAGKTIGNLVINTATGAVTTLGDALNMGATRALTISAGTLDTSASNYSITTGSIVSSGTSTRSLALNSSTVTLSSTSTPLNFSGSGLTVTGSASTINITGSAVTFAGGGFSFPGTISFTSTSVDSNYKSTVSSITGANTFVNLTLGAQTSTGLKSLTLAANQTVTGTFTVTAPSNPWARWMVYSDTYGTARTITAAAVSLTDVDFQDITGAGAASWTGTRIGDCQGNSGITFSTPKTVYWSSTTAGSFQSANWATSIGGAGSSANYPLAQDTAVFPSSYPLGGSISQNIANYGTVDSSARTSNTITFAPSGADTYAVFGDLIYGTAASQSVTMRWLFANRASQSFTPTVGSMGSAFTVDSLTGTVTLNGNLTASGSSFLLTSGTFDANGYNVNMTGGSVNVSGSTTRTLAIGSGTWSMSSGWTATTTTNLTVTGTGVLEMTSSSTKTFAGGGYAYSSITLRQTGSGKLTITGSNTFGGISSSGSTPGDIAFTSGTTTTVGSFTAGGVSGNNLGIVSSSPGVRATLSQASGTVNAYYVALQDIAATGGATWNAVNSRDNGNNTGWNFITVAVATGNFLMFF